ncbi:unnamed protein product [Amoebophrya sp. A25]|nr:unnamed protein product [Amoebophrya sp. A25]|eukprot:GSA25T00016602001.1
MSADTAPYEFREFPPKEIALTWWGTVMTVWSYVRVFTLALIKEMAWFLQAQLGIEPGYSFRKRRRPGMEAVFIEHGYGSLADCWNRPISSSPSAYVKVVKRTRKSQTFFEPLKPLTLTDEEVVSTNLASYNYLGFGGVDNFCTEFVANCIAGPCGFSTCAARGGAAGTRRIHLELEAKISDFLGKEDALVYGMGFATNSIHIPALVDPEGDGRGALILSDILNHRSIVEGVRMSGVSVKPFKHNDMVDLEHKLRDACENGQPNGKGQWRKIIVIVEGIYSMEGDFCRLREIVALKNKYGAYLYLDEAHSIGAVGASGRGVSELLNVPTGMIDLLMGTFTKSFGSAGGYIAGDKVVIDSLRKHAASSGFSVSMSPACAAQAYAALHVIQMDPVKGAAKLKSIRENSNYFREKLMQMGYSVLGDVDSPVIPVLMDPLGMLELSKRCLDLGVAIVVVGYPATPFLLNRARFCISAAHTRPQLESVLDILREQGEKLGLLYNKRCPKLLNWDYYRYIRECRLETKEASVRRPMFERLASREKRQEDATCADARTTNTGETKKSISAGSVSVPVGREMNSSASTVESSDKNLVAQQSVTPGGGEVDALMQTSINASGSSTSVDNAAMREGPGGSRRDVQLSDASSHRSPTPSLTGRGESRSTASDAKTEEVELLGDDHDEEQMKNSTRTTTASTSCSSLISTASSSTPSEDVMLSLKGRSVASLATASTTTASSTTAGGALARGDVEARRSSSSASSETRTSTSSRVAQDEVVNAAELRSSSSEDEDVSDMRNAVKSKQDCEETETPAEDEDEDTTTGTDLELASHHPEQPSTPEEDQNSTASSESPDEEIAMTQQSLASAASSSCFASDELRQRRGGSSAVEDAKDSLAFASSSSRSTSKAAGRGAPSTTSTAAVTSSDRACGAACSQQGRATSTRTSGETKSRTDHEPNDAPGPVLTGDSAASSSTSSSSASSKAAAARLWAGVSRGHDPCHNGFCMLDPLGLAKDPPPHLATRCNEYLWRNGFGACGPRGFYGGTMEHLLLEQKLASFLDKEECVLYSHSVTVASSVFESMVLAKDHVYCQDNANFGIKAGLRLNRSGNRISFFRDLDHLKELLEEKDAVAQEKVGGAGIANGRCYVVAEALCHCDGKVLDLPALLELKNRFHFLLALDESFSFAALGRRGISDYFNVSIRDVDVIFASLEYGVAGIGGFCVTSHALIRDLRLTSSGYCFSASAPGVSCKWGLEVLDMLEAGQLDGRLESLRCNSEQIRERLRSGLRDLKIEVSGDGYMFFLRPCNDAAGSSSSTCSVTRLRRMQKAAESKGVVLDLWQRGAVEKALLRRFNLSQDAGEASLRLCVSCLHFDEQIADVVSKLTEAFRTCTAALT